MKQLGPLWTRLVDIVKTRDGAGKGDWMIIQAVLEREERTVGDIPKAASGKVSKR